jgi:hypothetical protein
MQRTVTVERHAIGSQFARAIRETVDPRDRAAQRTLARRCGAHRGWRRYADVARTLRADDIRKVYATLREHRHRRDGQRHAIDDVAAHQPGDDEREIALSERDERGLDRVAPRVRRRGLLSSPSSGRKRRIMLRQFVLERQQYHGLHRFACGYP